MKGKLIKYGKCKLCALADSENALMRKQVLTGKKSCKDIAKKYKKLEVSEDDVYEHIYYHDQQGTCNVVGVEYIYEKVNKMVIRIEACFNMITIGEELDLTTVRMLTSISQELRKSIELLVTLEEKTGDNKTERELMAARVKYEKLKNVLIDFVKDDKESDRLFKKLQEAGLID